MPRPHTFRRSLAATAALVVGTWGAAALPAQAADAHADHAEGHAHADTHGHAASSGGQAKGEGRSGGKGTGKGHHTGTSHTGTSHTGTSHTGTSHTGTSHAGHGHPATGHPATDHHHAGNGAAGHHTGGNHSGGTQAGGNHAAAHGDPAGNNGTVKIAPLGEMDGIPQNSPHPGCTFQVEWYGYDEGADIISTVTFAMQAPTKDVSLTVDGPSTVFVGGDPATGAGTATGLDGQQAYTLSFDGAPQAQQGYHVKLTVATPRSKGNDTKTKVFWVQQCATGSTAGTGTDTTGTDTTGTDTTGTDTTGTDTPDTDTNGTDVSAPGASGSDTPDDIEVLGTQASATSNGSTEVSPAQASGSGTGVPTAVDAGEGGQRSVADWVRSPLPLLAVALGLAVLAGGVVTRRRRAGSLER